MDKDIKSKDADAVGMQLDGLAADLRYQVGGEVVVIARIKESREGSKIIGVATSIGDEIKELDLHYMKIYANAIGDAILRDLEKVYHGKTE